MRDWARLPTLLAATAVALTCCAERSSGRRTNDIPRYDVDDGRQWLDSGAERNANLSVLHRGAMAAAFNETSAERLLRSVIESQPRSDAANQAHELLSRIYLRSGQYTRLIENLDRWATSFPNRSEVQTEKADIEQFRSLPNQRHGEKRVSILAHDPGDDWSVPLSINGKSARYLLDTGAWLSAMTESEATRLGLEIRAGSGTLGDPSGKGVTVRTAIAKDVSLGAMRFQEVSFAILPNVAPFSAMSPGEGGILGMPIVLAVGHVKWSKRGTWELGGRSEPIDRTSRNLVFSENHLLLATSVFGTRVFGTLDTGAVDTDLNENFSTRFPSVMQTGTRQDRDISGLGGTVSVASVTVPEVLFQIGATRTALRPAHVTLQRTAAIGGTCCIGNIGRDLLGQTGELTLDLSGMVLQLQ